MRDRSTSPTRPVGLRNFRHPFQRRHHAHDHGHAGGGGGGGGPHSHPADAEAPPPVGAAPHAAVASADAKAAAAAESDDEHEHYAHRAPWLRAGVLGANDGLVSTASLMLGVGGGRYGQGGKN
jgi:hypothetical protein